MSVQVRIAVYESHGGPVVADAEFGYHATPRENVNAILREGLRANGATGYGRDNVIRHIAPAVHMADDEGAASGFIQCLYELDDPDVAVFRVDLRGLTVRVGWDGEGTYAVEDDISPNRLEFIH